MKTSRMNHLKKVPLIVWLGLLGAIILDTAVQIIWKTLIVRLPDGIGFINVLELLCRQLYFYYLLILFAVQFFCWMIILGKADLTYVKPFTSLSLVTVAICAALVFNEHLGSTRISGIILIIIGVWLTSETEYKTQKRVTGDAPHSRGHS